jgi:hypothetical protein
MITGKSKADALAEINDLEKVTIKFLEKLSKLRLDVTTSPDTYCHGGKANAIAKRASTELSEALVIFRRG